MSNIINNSNVISFTAFRNAKRAAEEITRREEANAVRVANEKRELADKLGGTIGAAIVADVAVDLQEREKAAKHTYMPAYCDPANETRGAKHDATRNLDITEIAKRMRADVKALRLPKGIKVSVRCDRFSGGQSIDMRVTVPESFIFHSEAMASWHKQFGDRKLPPLSREEQMSAEYNELKAKLDAIHGAYNRDNSDSMTDYFDVRYYGHVTIEGSWAALKREAEASAGTYWHESCGDR